MKIELSIPGQLTRYIVDTDTQTVVGLKTNHMTGAQIKSPVTHAGRKEMLLKMAETYSNNFAYWIR